MSKDICLIFQKLFGTAEGLQEMSRWVIKSGSCDSSGGARDAFYCPSLSLSIAEDLLWLCFEVLEATGTLQMTH